MSSDLGPDCEEILAGRPFYLRAGMSVSTGMSTNAATRPPEEATANERACPLVQILSSTNAVFITSASRLSKSSEGNRA